ncbi:5-hydroxytryptamine receptor 3A-like isoform X2 [Halichoeres trimaculatus]|uniref:5-hydroxytryptamine receptor 3A-like isoform X2 n=1 Tax=Halichoeres trimaculatus TaxID=147232 RepID=UPI003D9E1F8E
MCAGFLFLLLLTGGSSSNHTQPPDAEGLYNQSHLEGESSSNQTQSPDDQNSRGDGSSSNHTQPPDDQYDSEEGDLPDHCADADVIKHLNLSDKVKFYQARPTKHNRRSTNVTLFIYLYSILDVKEKEQELVAYFWMVMWWRNKFINWKPRDFCGTSEVTVPAELLWKPDLTIEEVYDGWIHQKSGMVLVSTCKMDFHRFPFDTQICNLTFKSIQHPSRQMKLLSALTNNDILSFTGYYMKTESEWLLMDVTVDTSEVYNFGFFLSVLDYTMTIKRRSVLYVANFIVPVLFFLCLDLASFLISESGGEKLSFKVTVLLAVTVMQLILNDILPPSSDRIPLIAVYCIGVFTLMMLSLLETILMMYLMEKDHVSQDQEADKDQSLDMNKSIPCVRVFDQSPAGMPPELLPQVKEGSSSQLTQETQDSENLSDELREVLKTVVLLLSSRKEEKEPGYWTTKTKTLNRIYFIVYFLAASVFLVSVFSVWLHEDR